MYQKLTERLKRRFSGATDEHITAALNDGLADLGYEVMKEAQVIEEVQQINVATVAEEIEPIEEEAVVETESETTTDDPIETPEEIEPLPPVYTVDVAREDMTMVLAYVSYLVASDLATNAASYFSYTDGGESIDKTGIIANYRTLAAEFKSEYDREQAQREADEAVAPTLFRVMKRVDRD